MSRRRKSRSAKALMEKGTNKMPKIDSKAVIWIRDRLYPLLIILSKPKIKYDIVPLNCPKVLPGMSVIFAGNHATCFDFPVLAKVTNRRSYVLIGKQNLPFVDRAFFTLNGAIFADRKSKMETAEAKRKLLKYLSMNQSIVWFPEGTWNLTPNLLMLPMKWGIIEVADQANAQIIPVVLDFNRAENVCRVKFADPIAGNVFKDKTEAIRLLRDTMSSLRWEMISNKPVLSRAEADFEMPQSEIKKSIAEYSALDWEYEKSCIYVPPNHIAPYMAFEHLRDLIPCRENAFLLSPAKKCQ